MTARPLREPARVGEHDSLVAHRLAGKGDVWNRCVRWWPGSGLGGGCVPGRVDGATCARARGMGANVVVTEINPIFDQRNRTAELAVELILSALGKTIL